MKVLQFLTKPESIANILTSIVKTTVQRYSENLDGNLRMRWKSGLKI